MNSAAWLEAYRERCAIVEFEAGIPREKAEVKAWDMTVASCGPAPFSMKRPVEEASRG